MTVVRRGSWASLLASCLLLGAGSCLLLAACGSADSSKNVLAGPQPGSSGSSGGFGLQAASSGGGGSGTSSGSGSSSGASSGAGDDSGAGSSGGASGGSSGASGGSGGSGDAGDASSDEASVASGPAPTSASATSQGTCTVQSYTSGLAGGQDYVTPTVYYSTDCPGPFPGVVVIPGFTETQSAVNQWGTFLASHGFVVMCVDTASGGTANTGVAPQARASGLAEAVTTLQGENTRSGSPLFGKLNTSLMAIMGHSMGGGGTLIAANAHPELKAAIGLCPWNPGGTYPMDTVPSLFFDGSADILVPPSAATPEYQSIPTTTAKIYAEFDGGTHYVANTPLGGAASDMVVARIGLSWLEVHVVGDTRYAQFLVKDSSMSAWDMKP